MPDSFPLLSDYHSKLSFFHFTGLRCSDSELKISNSSIENSVIKLGRPFLVTVLCNVTFNHVRVFNNSYKDYYHSFFNTQDSSITIRISWFDQKIVKEIILKALSSNIAIFDTNFENNSATLLAITGTLYVENCSFVNQTGSQTSLIINGDFEGLIFNSLLDSALSLGEYYDSMTKVSLTIDQSHITSLLYCDNYANLTITNSNLTGSYRMRTGYFSFCIIRMSKCRVYGNSAVNVTSGFELEHHEKFVAINKPYSSEILFRYPTAIPSVHRIRASTMYISESLFFNNSGKEGGCFQIVGGSKVYITQSHFWDNVALDVKPIKQDGSGGVFFLTQEELKISHLQVTSTVFSDNNAQNRGGVLHAQFYHNMTFFNCTFLNNTAAIGGVASVEGANATFDNCTFEKNVAFNESGVVSSTGKIGPIYGIQLPTWKVKNYFQLHPDRG